MKNALFFGLVIIMAFFMSCTTTNEKLAMSSLYSISEEKSESIHGTLNVNRLLIHKQVRSGDNRIITLDRFTSGTTTGYVIAVDYLGPSWLFIDALMIKIDDGGVITLTDSSPVRNVESNKGVNEIAKFTLNDNIVEQLRHCNNLVLQYTNQMVTIPANGIEAIKQFLNN